MNIFSINKCAARPDAQLVSEAQDWLILLTSGRATVADARALRQWCERSPQHALVFEQSKALWHDLKPAGERLQQQAWGRQFGRRAFLGGALAASAAFFMVQASVPGGFAGLAAEYSTAVGEQRRFDLADGGSLELNTQTRITSRNTPDGKSGFELLSGEVEVLARQQQSLSLQAGTGWISAAHSRFNVRNTDQRVCVTCLEGVMQVLVQGRNIELQSGRQITYDTHQVSEPTAVDTSAVVAWRQQILVFNDATLATVIDEINRYRPGMLLLLNTELGKRKVQARFSLDQLAGVALLIRDAYGAKCTELPGGIVLLS
ncbi:FecR domain-containing protein [Pseudomonas syringae]|nr:FecR domain-containing protein [Pseudomonas syringae]